MPAQGTTPMPEEDFDDQLLDDEGAELPDDIDEDELDLDDEELTEEDLDEEDEEDGDDVEASLDVILKSRLVVVDDEEEDEEDAEDEDGGERETATRVLPKQPGEFVCQSCF